MQINSSNIREADYDRKSRLLRMTFINRPRWEYTYYNVPPTIWARFLQASSKGGYFSDFIRDVFRYSRIIK